MDRRLQEAPLSSPNDDEFEKEQVEILAKVTECRVGLRYAEAWVQAATHCVKWATWVVRAGESSYGHGSALNLLVLWMQNIGCVSWVNSAGSSNQLS